MSSSRPTSADYESAPSIRRREIRGRLSTACAIAHGCGAKLSANDLMELVLEKGLPSRVEREAMLREKLGDKPPSPPPPS